MVNRWKTNYLIECLQEFPVLALIGPRQVGKTTLAKYLIAQINKKAVYLDLENPKDLAKLQDPVFYFEQHKEQCVVLDEVQNVPEMITVLRSMVDDYRVPSRFIILGSASPSLIQKSSETLAGRIVFEEISPLNSYELGSSVLLGDHFFRGGFPEPLFLKTDRIRNLWQQNFIRTYLERDLPLLGLNVNPQIIRKLWVMLAHCHGQLLNVSALARSLGLSVNTVNRYLSFLEGAFLIRLLHPYSTNLKKRLVKTPKVYIRDTGILHQLLGIENPEDLWSHPVLGASWESFAIEQIVQLLPQNYTPYFYRTHEGAELDLVIERGGNIVFTCEFKYSSTASIQKGAYNCVEDLATKNNFLISFSGESYKINETFETSSLQEFIEKYISTFLP
jgi:predicted AAA+ superfamily ATPase